VICSLLLKLPSRAFLFMPRGFIVVSIVFSCLLLLGLRIHFGGQQLLFLPCRGLGHKQSLSNRLPRLRGGTETMWRSNTAGTAIVISSDDSDSEELPPFKFARYSY